MYGDRRNRTAPRVPFGGTLQGRGWPVGCWLSMGVGSVDLGWWFVATRVSGRGFSHKEAAQADAQEEAQEDAQGDPLAAAGRKVVRGALVENLRCPVHDFSVHWVEVALHGRDRVGVMQDLLDVEEVETMGSVRPFLPVEDPGCAAA